MFIGREKELTILEDAYNTGAFQLLVVYGRRRVGKLRFFSILLLVSNMFTFLLL